MNAIWLTEVIDECKSEGEAAESLGALSLQDGFICGRILQRAGGKPWRAQAFFPDVGESDARHLPDGCHRRLVPESLLGACRR